MRTNSHSIRTSNIHTHTTFSSRSQLFSIKYSRLKMQRNALEVWNEIPNEYKKFVKEVLQKRNKKSSWLNILETEDSYLKPNKIMLKFKHSKTEPIWTSATICFVHWETLGLSFLYKWTSVISFFFPFLVYLFVFLFTFLHFCFISSVLK